MGLLDNDYKTKLAQFLQSQSAPHQGLDFRTQQGLIELDRATAPQAPVAQDYPMGGRTVNPAATVPHPGGTGERMTPEQFQKLQQTLKSRQVPK